MKENTLPGETRRDETVDFIKGCLILGVIWGHTITALSLDHFESSVWIHSFFRVYDMPLFMILSGFFLKTSAERYTTKTLLLNRVGMILIPIVFWNLVRGTLNMKSLYFLWAVFSSSMICGLGHFIGKKTSRYFELGIYLCVIVSFHLFRLPWNMFYLFPFFCVGYYMKDMRFRVSTKQFVALLMLLSVGMCFWKSDYTPWRCNGIAWRSDINALWIYGYRFCIAIIASYIMVNMFRIICHHTPTRVTQLVLKAGRETLALYVLQFLVIETLLHRLMTIVDTSWYACNPDAVHNLIGYLFAPVISVVTIVSLLKVVEAMKNWKWTKWTFGIKLVR